MGTRGDARQRLRYGYVIIAVAATMCGITGLERYRYGGGLVEGGHVRGTGYALDGEREPVGQIKRDRLRRRRLGRLRLRVDRQPDARGGGGQQTFARGRLMHRTDHGQLHECGGRRLMVLMVVVVLCQLLVVVVLLLLLLLVMVVQEVVVVLLAGGSCGSGRRRRRGHRGLLGQRVRRETVTDRRGRRGRVMVRRYDGTATAPAATAPADASAAKGDTTATARTTHRGAGRRDDTVVVRRSGRRTDQTVMMMVVMAHPRPTTGRAQAHAWFFHYNKLTVSSAASSSRFRQVRRQHHFLRLRLFTFHLKTTTRKNTVSSSHQNIVLSRVRSTSVYRFRDLYTRVHQMVTLSPLLNLTRFALSTGVSLRERYRT